MAGDNVDSHRQPIAFWKRAATTATAAAAATDSSRNVVVDLELSLY